MLLALLTLASFNLCRSQIFEVPCKTDVVYGAGGQEFVWMGNWALSKPLCFDKNYFLKSRNCKNGKWSPLYGICYGFKCPDGFVQNTSTCIYHTQPVPYSTPCPDPAELLDNPTTVPDISWHSRINSTICQIVDRETLTPTFCNRNHSKQCSYSHKLMSGLKSNNSDHDVVEVALNFDAGKRQMFLIVYEVRKLPSMSIQCYTNGGLNAETVKTFDSRKDNRYVRNFVVYEVALGPNRAQYWCHVFISRSVAPINTQKVIGYTQTDAPQYSAIIPLDQFCAGDKCTRESLGFKVKQICPTHCALMQIDDFDPDLNKGALIVHVTARSEKILKNLRDAFKNNSLEFADVRSNEFCPFELERLGDEVVKWDRTSLSTTTTPRELCFDGNGTLVVRKCGGDFIYGARWEDPSGRCSQRDLPTKTKKLHELLKGDVSGAIDDVTEITSDSAKLNVADVNLVAEILPKIETDEASPSFAKIVNNVIKAKGDVLREAQVLLNATDRILCSIETYYNEKNPIDATESHFIVRILKPFVDNITGLALYKRTEDFTRYDQVKIRRHETFDDVIKVGLELAFYLPETLLRSMAAKHEGRVEELKVVAKIFYDDSLLKEQKETNLVGSRVVAVSIPGFGVYLEAPVYLLFRPLGDVEGANCGFWDYGAEKKGWWSTTGQNHFKRRDDSLIECSFSHNTPYAILVTRLTKLFEHEWVLDLLTYSGSGISFIGIIGIFVTALLFKPWRGKVGTKILLQLSLLIALELIFTQLSGLQALYEQTESCRVVGVFLHYVVLAKFTWMLAVAYLQYKKFVKVIGSLPPRLLLKSSVFGWLSPLVIVTPTVLISLRDYSSGMMMFCYPYDIVFYVGLYAPFVLVISANVVIFYKIMTNISNSESKRYSDENFTKRTTVLQVRQAILFVFLFGITWTFGLMADVTRGWVKLSFVYLFCLTAPLQGFILFIFYVVLDRETKYHWTTFFRKK